MTPDRALKVMNWSVAALVAAAVALFALSGCAMFTAALAAVKKVFLVFALAGAGAFVGLAAGPLGAVVGAGTGAVVGATLDENVDLRSGALQGEGARDNETDRLKALLMLSQGELQVKERSLRVLEETTSWWRTWSLRILLGGLVTRNLANFPKLAQALLAKRWALAVQWFLHILIWPVRPKAVA